CFDLKHFIAQEAAFPTYTCPLCREPATLDQLFIDGFTQNLVDSFPDWILAVRFGSDGLAELVPWPLPLRGKSKQALTPRANPTAPRASRSSPKERRCANCGTRESSCWRTGWLGPRSLCSSCGSRWVHAGKPANGLSANGASPSSPPLSHPAPALLTTPIAGATPAKLCASCGTVKTPMWRPGPAGPRTLCNGCGIRLRREKLRLSDAACPDSAHTPGSPSAVDTPVAALSPANAAAAQEAWRLARDDAAAAVACVEESAVSACGTENQLLPPATLPHPCDLAKPPLFTAALDAPYLAEIAEDDGWL
ncbi:hypothetical protein HK405_008724, partial [Cladochytrium tenue]